MPDVAGFGPCLFKQMRAASTPNADFKRICESQGGKQKPLGARRGIFNLYQRIGFFEIED